MRKLNNTVVSFTLILIFVSGFRMPCLAQDTPGDAANIKAAPKCGWALNNWRRCSELV